MRLQVTGFESFGKLGSGGLVSGSQLWRLTMHQDYDPFLHPQRFTTRGSCDDLYDCLPDNNGYLSKGSVV